LPRSNAISPCLFCPSPIALQTAERALFTRRRKDAYEALHPETKNGGDRRSSDCQVGELKSERFTADIAKKTGQSEAPSNVTPNRRAVGRQRARPEIGARGRNRSRLHFYIGRNDYCTVIIMCCGYARLWEIAENLHQSDLTEAERRQHIAEWVKLTAEKVAHSAHPLLGGMQPPRGE
jgi:hypothetical protein